MFATIVAGLLAAMPAAGAVTQFAEPAPTGVTLAWESTEDSRFVVTWQETGALGNKIELVDPEGSSGTGLHWEVAAGAPNRVVINEFLNVGQQFRIRVVAVDAANEPVSDPALSAVFDTDLPANPILTSFIPREDGTLVMRWRPGSAKPDTTPGDPLDLPAGDAPTFVPIAAFPNFNDYDDISSPTTATTFIVKAREFPAVLGVRTTRNGWGYGAATGAGARTRLTAKVPGTATDGARMRVTGKVYETNRFCDPGPCWNSESLEPNRAVQLQSRTSATADWKVVGTATSTVNGDVQFTVVSPGPRQYRLVAPVVAPPAGRVARTSFATSPVTTVSRPPAAGPGGGAPGNDPGNGGGDTPGDDGDEAGDGGGNGGPGDGGPLPITGGPVTTVAGTGAALLAAGILLFWVGRRRRTASPRSGS